MTRVLLSVLAVVSVSLAAPAGAAPAAPEGRTGLVRFEYAQPKDPAHRPLYDHLRERKTLENFAQVLGAIRLPRPLTLRFAGCDGESNAWYDDADQSVTFCYEFVTDFEKAAAGAAAYGISHDDAGDGAVTYVILHETAHALFALLRVPILGREEDAADQVAAYTLLRAGKGIARRALSGAAWMYKHDASARTLDDSDYADVHGLDVQRLYNVLCIAYGAYPADYAGVVEKGYLPKDRADGCHDEYEQVAFAVRTLVSKSLDVRQAERTRAQHQARWDAGPAPSPAAAPAPVPEKR